MSELSEINKKAREKGMSYGEYVSLNPCPPPRKPLKRKRNRKCDISTIFSLWQQGYSDAQIAKHLGTSRTLIQKYRDTYEIPANKTITDTHKYHLIETSYGIFVMKE